MIPSQEAFATAKASCFVPFQVHTPLPSILKLFKFLLKSRENSLVHGTLTSKNLTLFRQHVKI